MIHTVLPARANAPPSLEGSIPLPAHGVPNHGFQALLQAAASQPASQAGAVHDAAPPPDVQPGVSFQTQDIEGEVKETQPEEELPSEAGERGAPQSTPAGLAFPYAVGPGIPAQAVKNAGAPDQDETAAAAETRSGQPVQARHSSAGKNRTHTTEGAPDPAQPGSGEMQEGEAVQNTLQGRARQADQTEQTSAAPPVGPSSGPEEHPETVKNLPEQTGTVPVRGETRPERSPENTGGSHTTGAHSARPDNKAGPLAVEELPNRTAELKKPADEAPGHPHSGNGPRAAGAAAAQTAKPDPLAEDGSAARLDEVKPKTAGRHPTQAAKPETQAGGGPAAQPAELKPHTAGGAPTPAGRPGPQTVHAAADRQASASRDASRASAPFHQTAPETQAATSQASHTAPMGEPVTDPKGPTLSAVESSVHPARMMEGEAESGGVQVGEQRGTPGSPPPQSVKGDGDRQVERQDVQVKGNPENPCWASLQAGQGEAELPKGGSMSRRVHGTQFSMQPEAGGEPAEGRTVRKTGGSAAPRGEPLTFGAELAPHAGIETAAEGVRPVVSPGPGADEKMISFVRQVGQRIEGLVKSGKTSLEIQLAPEQLGKIDLKLVSTPQGTSVVIQTENASTGWLLEQNLPQLRQSLTEAGVQLSGLSVGQNSAHSPSSQGQPGSFRGAKGGAGRSTTGSSSRIEAGSKRYEWSEPGLAARVNYLV